MSTRWDIVVVGARAAGASTALLLARAGLRVLCVERSRLGSDTVSTHALMRGGTLQLQRWGLLGQITDAGTPPVRRTIFHYGSESEAITIDPYAGVDALYAPRRTLIDRLLAEAAAAAGATFRFGCAVVALDRDPAGRVAGVLVRDRDGSHRTERAGLVVGADGRQSYVAQAAHPTSKYRGRAASSFLYGYFADLPVDGYEWFYGPRVSAGAVPTNDGLTCAFVGAPADRVDRLVAQGGRAHALRRLSGKCAIGGRLDPTTLVGGLRHVRGAPGHLLRSSGPGWALVGDAGFWKDPMSAHGMTDAYRDAELLARAVLAAPNPGPEQGDSLREYEHARDALALPLLEVTERLASYRWTVEDVRGLLLRLASVMADELEVITGSPEAA